MDEGILTLIIIVSCMKIFTGNTFNSIIPEQIHLSFGDSPENIVVTWVTFSFTPDSIVWYRVANEELILRAEGFSWKFVDGGTTGTVRYIHKVVLPYLKSHTFYVYRCGSFYALSEAFVFKTIPKDIDWSPRVIVYGDMGLENAVIYPFLLQEKLNFEVDVIFHVGDIAYNLDSYDGEVGDEFLRMIQPIASSIPYMTVVGNHEQAFNFSHYKNKFSMPGNNKGLFYSFNLGPAHLVVVSTEVYYFPEYGVDSLVTQYNWLEKDLEMASESKNRSLRPWIIVFGHRPMYCSSDTEEDCSFEANILKCCFFNSSRYSLESLFRQNRVDLCFWGHMHYYERSWPIYNNQVYNGSFFQPYRNPGATVHVITGAAGMKSGTESASYVRPDWFPFYSKDYSYTLLTISNKTHLYLEQISADRNGEVIDSFWIVKDKNK